MEYEDKSLGPVLRNTFSAGRTTHGVLLWLSAGFRALPFTVPVLYTHHQTDQMIHVMSDLLYLFSFLLTVILFPLDRADRRRGKMCACVHLCVCVSVSRIVYPQNIKLLTFKRIAITNRTKKSLQQQK